MVPIVPSSNSSKSPILTDFSNKRIIPPIKFETIFCKPKPIPIPKAPPITAKVVPSIPITFNITKNTIK